jgi:hypothetical protein
MTTELRPWQSGESILDVVRAGRDELPDEPPRDPEQISWSAGSLDGVVGRHIVAPQREGGLLARARRRLGLGGDPSARLFAVLADLAAGGSERERLAVYRAAQDPDLVVRIDGALERLVAVPQLLPPLAPHARWLVTEARHRGPAKLGIALLGLCGEPDDLDVIETLARHDEFTLYCSVAMRNLLADPVDALWAAARAAGGWGKIEAVERLAPLVADRPDVKRWLLVDGCANEVMDEYLGYACATAGELASALAGEVDDALLDGACTIVTALCIGGPAQDMDDYADGPRAVELLLDQLRTRCTTLERLEAVLTIREWLEPDPPDEDDEDDVREVTEREALLVEIGWTAALRERLAATCSEILARPEWPGRVRDAIGSGERLREWIAWRLAPAIGVDLWEEAFAMLEGRPIDAGRVWRVVYVDDRERRRRVIAWAEANLPLAAIAEGPGLHLTPERDGSEADHALNSIVQAMRDPELYSEALVAAALRSPVINTRWQAIHAIEARPAAQWGPLVVEALRRSAADDPREDVRERVRTALAQVPE